MEDLRPRDWIGLIETPGGYEIRIRAGDDQPLGLRIHSGEWKSASQRLMRRSGADILEKGRACRFAAKDRQAAKDLSRELGEELLRISRKPIGQRIVQEKLGISSAERSRWSKDERLQRRGSAQITSGRQTINLWTYCPLQIDWLSRNPQIIAGWRAEDAAASTLA